MNEMQAQARICPICIDDHSEVTECKPKDLTERIDTLRLENQRLKEELVQWKSWQATERIAKENERLKERLGKAEKVIIYAREILNDAPQWHPPGCSSKSRGECDCWRAAADSFLARDYLKENGEK